MKSEEQVLQLIASTLQELKSAEQRNVAMQISYYEGMLKALKLVLLDEKKVKEELWVSPASEGDNDKEIIKKFTAEESKEINKRLNEKMGVDKPQLIKLKELGE